jgi:hypothetical protein
MTRPGSPRIGLDQVVTLCDGQSDYQHFKVVSQAQHQANLGFTGSLRTMTNVQMGPKNKEANHQLKPLRPLLCANPALIKESVNHPTAYWPEFSIAVINVGSCLCV